MGKSIIGDFFDDIGNGIGKLCDGEILDGVGNILGGTLKGAFRTIGFAGKTISEVTEAIFFGKIKNIHWAFPLIPQIIQFAVLSFVLSVLILLYLTIGIAFHCYAMFESLRIDAITGIKSSNEMISKSAYALTSGIYLVLAALFWVVLLPFRLIG